MTFADWVRHRRRFAVGVVKRTDQFAGFRAVPKRWVVERTLAWLRSIGHWCGTTNAARPERGLDLCIP